MVEITTVDASDCKLLSNPKFSSQREVKKASRTLRVNVRHPEANEIVNSYREFRLCCLKTSLKLLESLPLSKNALVSARLKRIDSIWRKLMKTEEDTYVSGMDDIIGFRVIYSSFSDLQSSVKAIEKDCENVRIRNYIDQGHPINIGYRGAHAVISFQQPFADDKRSLKVKFEVQLRTYYQHQWACWCESMGEQAKEGYPDRRDDPEIQRRLKHFRRISNHIKEWEENHKDSVQNDGGQPFPEFSDLAEKIAIVRPSAGQDSVSMFSDTNSAFQEIRDFEDKEIKVALLLGLTKDKVERHLKETHPNFVYGFFPEPEDWLPK